MKTSELKVPKSQNNRFELDAFKVFEFKVKYDGMTNLNFLSFFTNGLRLLMITGEKNFLNVIDFKVK